MRKRVNIIPGEFWVDEYTNGENHPSILQIMASSNLYVITNHVYIELGQIGGIQQILISDFFQIVGLRRANENEIKIYQDALKNTFNITKHILNPKNLYLM